MRSREAEGMNAQLHLVAFAGMALALFGLAARLPGAAFSDICGGSDAALSDLVVIAGMIIASIVFALATHRSWQLREWIILAGGAIAMLVLPHSPSITGLLGAPPMIGLALISAMLPGMLIGHLAATILWWLAVSSAPGQAPFSNSGGEQAHAR